MRDIREAQGGIQGWLLEAELRLTQMQALLVGMRWEVDLLGGVVTRCYVFRPFSDFRQPRPPQSPRTPLTRLSSKRPHNTKV